MSRSEFLLKRTLFLSAIASLVACGGGGGGGDAGIAASAPLTVTSANAPQVAGASMDASDGLTGNSEGIIGVVPAALGRTASSDVNIVETLINQIRKAPQRDNSRFNPAAVRNQTQDCESGSLSMSFNDVDNDQSLSTGDSVSMTASNCAFGGVTMNGSIGMSNVVVSGDQITPPYSMQFSLQASGFSVTSGSETVSMSGDGTIAESTDDGISFTSSFSGNGIEIMAAGKALTLTDYQIIETEDDASGAYSFVINATISSTNLGGSVRVTTDIPLGGINPYEPDRGQLTCVGSNNTSVRLTVIDSMSVQLDVDENGDGIAENTIAETWAAL